MVRCLRNRRRPARSTLLALALATFPVLVAIQPVSAMERIKSTSVPPDGGSGGGAATTRAMAGSIIRNANATTSWYLYPGACTDRANGTWAPKSTPIADSLNGYTPGTSGPYTVVDQSAQEILWHVSDNGTCTTGSTCPAALNDTRSLWCGKNDPGWAIGYGYPNFTYQILYIDTGHHDANYSFVLSYNFSGESIYDNAFLVGGGLDSTDPIGNSRAILDNAIATGSSGSALLLARWSGSITPSSAGATGGNTTGGAVFIKGDPTGSPSTVSGASFTIDAQHRALYLVFTSDCFNSSEDGLWPYGHGFMIDNVSTSDNGALYSEQTAAGGTDSHGGNVIRGTPGAPIISARVPGSIGSPWQLVAGSSLPTPDFCSPKNSASDLIFMGGDGGTFHAIPNVAASVVTCTFPIPAGTAGVVAQWNEYLDLPAYSGYVQFAEFRYFRDGFWSGWRNTDGGGTRRVDGSQAWGSIRSELAEAAQADSVQLRYSIRCVKELTVDGVTCGDVVYGILYDDFRLEVVTGASAPSFGIYPSFVAQTTFVDGTMAGTGCSGGTVAAGQCWPGVRGSDTGSGAVHDNFNSPLGDSIVVTLSSALRRNGKGINWHHGFDPSIGGGLTAAHTNPNFVSIYDKPRVIYRIFDPTTKTWSPFDSSELDANAVSVSSTDTILIGSRFRMNWPPRDRSGLSLPGGFTVTGKSLYSQLAFLPRGTRLQYYFKAVDLNGGTSYQFSTDVLAREVEDLPTLPGGSVVAPDIIEFDVLPRVYSTAGTAGTLVAGRTNTPLLNLDGSYGAWSFGVDPVTQALRAMGVRADRYRMLQGTEQGGNLGGHELTGARQGRLGNYFPNMEEYSIKDSLAGWYRILIESTHRRGSFSLIEEADAKLLQQWWEAPTGGTDGGDRCLLITGNDGMNALLAIDGVPHPFENALASQVFGVATVANAWNGSQTNHTPTVRDLFADPAGGPSLGTPGNYQYMLDGACPGPDRFDALTKIGSAEAQNGALYPTISGITNVAGVSYMTERDVIVDHDRNKSLSYGFSLQYVRQGGMNLLDARAQVLYKFLASCRGARSVTDTASCWPCPTDANKYGNWAVLSGFQTGTYGPLYAIQNGNLAAAAIEVTPPPSFADALMQNRPNPFNPETVIPFSLASPGRVAVRVYDVRGRLVRTLLDAIKPAGVHAARWNGATESGARAASGVYFYRITYPDGHTTSKKMAVLR